MSFRTDEILWYNPPGASWGELGYAAPNVGDDTHTLNNSIAYLVGVMGRNLSAVMHHVDTDMRRPPSINTLIRVHKLITRARSIISSRAVPHNKLRMEPLHATPAPEAFLIFPVPYFKVRSPYLKEWCGLILNAISEACQHTENKIEYEFSTEFAGLIGQYLRRVYVRMATELLGVPLIEAEADNYTISDAVFGSYDPTKYFTTTELIDTVGILSELRTEDDLEVLTNGIPAHQLVGLGTWPLTLSGEGATSVAVSSPVPTTGSWVSPPAP